MAITNIAHTKSDGTNTPNIDTTGATLIVVVVRATSDQTMSDNKGNSYTEILWNTDYSLTGIRVYYKLNPAVGSGHNFSYSSSQSITVSAWSGVNTVGALDVSNSNNNAANSTTIQAGSITPSQDKSLIICGYTSVTNSGFSISINSGMTILETYTGASNENLTAYYIQPTAAAINPTWTHSSANNYNAAAIVAFKPAPEYILVAEAGAYALTGYDTLIKKIIRIFMDTGSYILTGNPVNIVKNMWTNVTKNISSWVNTDKS